MRRILTVSAGEESPNAEKKKKIGCTVSDIGIVSEPGDADRVRVRFRRCVELILFKFKERTLGSISL